MDFYLFVHVKKHRMSFILYVLYYLLADDTEEQVAEFPEYECRQPRKTTIYWDTNTRVKHIDELNLFDESTTPPLQMYCGEIKPIIRASSFTMRL